MRLQIRGLQVKDRIKIDHEDNYPSDELPPRTHFEHIKNTGNSYDGLSSILEVVEDYDEGGNLN